MQSIEGWENINFILPQIAALWASEDLKLNIGLLANETTLVDQPKYGCVDREWMRLRQNCRNMGGRRNKFKPACGSARS